MRKIVYVLVIAVIIILVGILRSGTSHDLKIGVLVPLTGNFGLIGERMKNGFELAKQDILKEDKVRIDMVYEDACQPKEAISAITKMIQIDKITLLGGSFCVAGFVPVIPILEQNHIIGFNTAPNPDSTLNHRYIVSTNGSIKKKAAELATFARTELNAKTVAILYYSTPLGEDYRKYFQEKFEMLGGKVVLNQVTLIDATDFRSELLKIKEQKPDLVFVVQLAKPLANLLKEARELGLSSKILGNSSNEDVSVLEAAGVSAEGFLISSDEPLQTEKISDFENRYREQFKQSPDVFARNAYDALMLQSQAYKKCGGENDCMLSYFRSIKNYSGVSGSITIETDGTASKPTSFKVVKDGKFVPFIVIKPNGVL
jgi:branched-chain amino acid transport system substrate-binding protein